MRFVANSPLWLRTIRSVWTATKARLRSVVKVHELRCLRLDKQLAASRIVLICIVRDEAVRLPYFFGYYRSMGVQSFIIVDNGSTDGSLEFVRSQPDTSLFVADGSFKKSRFGLDWVNHILSRYCHDKWVIFPDADEFLVFADCDQRTLKDLTNALEQMKCCSLPCMMLDMYSDKNVVDNVYQAGQDPLEVCDLFDASGYVKICNRDTRTTWIKGGVRARNFFHDPQASPALNKTPLVKWKRYYLFLKSQHELWPARLNSHHHGFNFIGGCLLHFKFMSSLREKLAEECVRRQHTREYEAYRCLYDQSQREPMLRGEPTRQFRTWQSLVACGIITPIDWTVVGYVQHVQYERRIARTEMLDPLPRDADGASKIIGGRAFQ